MHYLLSVDLNIYLTMLQLKPCKLKHSSKQLFKKPITFQATLTISDWIPTSQRCINQIILLKLHILRNNNDNHIYITKLNHSVCLLSSTFELDKLPGTNHVAKDLLILVNIRRHTVVVEGRNHKDVIISFFRSVLILSDDTISRLCFSRSELLYLFSKDARLLL